MEWRQVPEFPDYEVSECGDVRRLTDGVRYRRGKPMRGGVDHLGYRRYKLTKGGTHKYAKAHRLVAMAFLPRVPGKEIVAHWDGNVANNHVSNLRWATHRENAADRTRHGNTNLGEKHGRAKLTEAQVLKARLAYTNRTNDCVSLAREYGVSKSAMHAAITGKHWACL